jgi:hypothetical protein
MAKPTVSCLLVVCVLALAPLTARAQSADFIGIRAQGMGGAFTAVADDATATWWNPAGLGVGPFLSANVEYGRAPERDRDHLGIALGFPALGLSYYRLTVSDIRPASGSTGASAAGRQDQGTLDVRSLDVSQFGVSAGQSIGGRLIVASTLKLLRAAGETQGDLDIGALGAMGLLRVGVMVRNLREASFGPGDQAMTLGRQVRAGLAITTGQRAQGGGTIAVDADLRPVVTALGDERRFGVGAEIWTAIRSLGLGARAGISASTLGDRRAAPSAGLSLALHSGIFVDGQLTGGSDSTRRGWGLALRMTY